MGVYYSGNYGLGYKIEPIDFDDENLSSEIAELESMEELLDEKLDSEKYSWFKVGEGNYTGEQDDFYVAIEKPFENGIDGLKEKDKQLKEHLAEIGVTPKGELDAIGGLEVW